MSEFVRGHSLYNIIKCDAIIDINYNYLEQNYKCDDAIKTKYLVIFVKTDMLQYFIDNILPNIKKQFILMTGSSDLTPSEDNYVKVLQNNKLLKWICTNNTKKNEKIYDYPIGFSIEHFKIHSEQLLTKLYNSEQPNKINKILLPYHGNTNDYREKIVKKIGCNDIVVKLNKIDFNNYIEELKKYKFCIGIRGNGIDIHRIYECLLVRTFVIFIAEERFPIIDQLGFIQLNKDTVNNFINNNNIIDILTYLYSSVDWNEKIKYVTTKFQKKQITQFINNI